MTNDCPFKQAFDRKYRVKGKVFDSLEDIAIFYNVSIGVINSCINGEAKIAPDGYPIYVLWLPRRDYKPRLNEIVE